jgi:hypothetical protein
MSYGSPLPQANRASPIAQTPFQAQPQPNGQTQPLHLPTPQPQDTAGSTVAAQNHVSQVPPHSPPPAMPQASESFMDNEAEAALLKGLQAAMAEASSC